MDGRVPAQMWVVAGHSFVSRVHSNQVPKPDQRDFSVASWDHAFSAVAHPTDEDRRLYDAGRFIFDALQRVRALLQRCEVPGFSADELRGLLCAGINRDAHLILGMGPADAAPHEIAAPRLVEATMQLATGVRARPDAALTGLIDGARFCLSTPPIAKGREERRHREDDASVLSRLRLVSNLSVYYSCLLDIWNDCLWNGWSLDSSGAVDVISAPESPVERARAVGRHRLDALVLELTNRAVAIWQNVPKDKRESFDVRDVVMARAGKTRTFVLHNAAAQAYPPVRFLIRVRATELYLEELVRAPFLTDGDLSVKLLISAWELIASLADECSKRFPSDSSCYTLGKLRQYAPGFSRHELVGVLAKGLRCMPQVAARVLDYFVFPYRHNAELWPSPLIAIGDQKYLPVIGAARVPNIIRSVEAWLGKSGLDVAHKGPLFETHCRTRLRNALREAPILRRAGVLDRSIDVGGDQIDLLFWIGSTIIVGELKALSDAAQAFEFRTTLDDITTAARQAKRKAEAVRRHPDEVRTAIQAEHGVAVEVANVLPVIVTTLPIWTGLVWDGVPVADVLVLQTFIGRPTIQRWVRIDDRGREQPTAAEPIVLYTSEDEAEQRVEGYLLDPPQFDEYWRHLGREENVLPPLTGGHRPIVVRTWAVSPPDALHLETRTSSSGE